MTNNKNIHIQYQILLFFGSKLACANCCDKNNNIYHNIIILYYASCSMHASCI